MTIAIRSPMCDGSRVVYSWTFVPCDHNTELKNSYFWRLGWRRACVLHVRRWSWRKESHLFGGNLVDPASSHMLVSKIKPCMSKYKQIILWNCEWLIISVLIYLIVLCYLDNWGNSWANTCVKTRLLEGLYLLDKKPMQATALRWLIITFRIV
jgi:hypothetical protein